MEKFTLKRCCFLFTLKRCCLLITKKKVASALCRALEAWRLRLGHTDTEETEPEITRFQVAQMAQLHKVRIKTL